MHRHKKLHKGLFTYEKRQFSNNYFNQMSFLSNVIIKMMMSIMSTYTFCTNKVLTNKIAFI